MLSAARMAKLTKLIDLREGEARSVGFAALVLALLIASHTMLETARDALFLGKLTPERLPIVYLLLAGLSLVVARASAKLSRRLGRRNGLIFSLLASAYGTALLYFQPQTPAVVFGLYLWSGLLGTVLVLQFWMFGGQLFTVAQGKRLFGPIAAGGVLGAVSGASAAAALLQVLPVHALLLVSATLFAGCSLLLTVVPTDEARPPARTATETGPVRKNAGVLTEMPYLRRVGALVVLSTATVLITDYLFKSVAAATVPPEELGSFFALYYAVLNAVALVVQLVITGRLVKRLGVTGALTVLPLLLAFGGIGAVVLGGAVGVVLALKGADGALRHSLHRVTMELLYLPIPPDTRDRAKPVIETALGRGTQALTAGIVLGLTALGFASPQILAGLVAVLALGWLVVAITVRRPYIDLFRQALSRGTLDLSSEFETLNLNSVEAIMEALSSRDEDRVLAAMSILDENGRGGLIPGLILYHDSEAVLEQALAIVAKPGRRDWIPLAERLLSHSSEQVRAAALAALASAGLMDAVKEGAEDPSPLVRVQAMFFLVQGDADAVPAENPHIRELLAAQGPESVSMRCALLDAIRDHGDDRWLDVMQEVARSEDPKTLAHLAQAVQRHPDPRFIQVLVSGLTIRDGRGAVREAIALLGDEALRALADALEDPDTPSSVRLHIPAALADFESQEALDLLTERLTIEHDGAVRYRVLRALERLSKVEALHVDRATVEEAARKNIIEHLRILARWLVLSEGQEKNAERANDSGRVVLGMLEDKLRQSLERAFLLLQVAHRSEDIRSVYRALLSKDRQLRASALEFIDVLPAHAPSTRELFRLVADDMTKRERVARSPRSVGAAPQSYEDTMAELLEDRDESVAALTAYHALDLGIISLRDQVMETLKERPGLLSLSSPSMLPKPSHA